MLAVLNVALYMFLSGLFTELLFLLWSLAKLSGYLKEGGQFKIGYKIFFPHNMPNV